MNRLEDKDLHLLLDEPIYVLADHGDHPTEQAESEEQQTFLGKNEKGIGIFAENSNEEDISFLFKGLNALDITEQDVALFSNDFDSLVTYPDHTIRLRFSQQINLE